VSNKLEQYKILLVEDNRSDMLLSQAVVMDVFPHCQTFPVTSVQEAYDLLQEVNFNLVVLDLNLPDGHGPQTVQQVRSFNRNVPIVVLTGSEREITVNQALKLGADHVCLKSQLLNGDFRNILEEKIRR